MQLKDIFSFAVCRPFLSTFLALNALALVNSTIMGSRVSTAIANDPNPFVYGDPIVETALAPLTTGMNWCQSRLTDGTEYTWGETPIYHVGKAIDSVFPKTVGTISAIAFSAVTAPSAWIGYATGRTVSSLNNIGVNDKTSSPAP